MSSAPSVNSDVNRIITYWFDGDQPLKKWFQGGATVDAEISEKFSTLVTKARDSQLNSWKEEPKSTLALIILLDQFSRNLNRGSPDSYSKDSMTKEIAVEAIAKGYDREVDHLQQAFFYLPLMHDETLVGQVAALALYESLASRCSSDPQVVDFMKN